MGSRKRKRNIWPDATKRALLKKLKYNASEEEIKRYYAKLKEYSRLNNYQRLSAFKTAKDLTDPTMMPRVKDTCMGTKPKGWTTVWYSGFQRKK